MSESISSDEGPKCPYCGYVHSDAECWTSVVTFWGSEDGPVEYWCNECDQSFSVKEIVTRTWESIPIVQKRAKVNA